MKKVFISLSAIALMGCLAACGGSDAKKVADKYCECEQIGEGDEPTLEDFVKYAECRDEYKQLKDEVEAKFDKDTTGKAAYKAELRKLKDECK